MERGKRNSTRCSTGLPGIETQMPPRRLRLDTRAGTPITAPSATSAGRQDEISFQLGDCDRLLLFSGVEV
jgi:hypothetical protein